MPDQSLSIIRDQLSGNAALDTAMSRAILQRVTDGALGETLQVGFPHKVMAFGKHDTLTDGFADAVGIATDHGYDATVRIAGGRAVVFSPSILRFAWTMPVAEPARTMHDRFTTLAEAVVGALADVGIASAIGEIPNEYCAGQYSVNVLGSRKVMGVGQRLSRSAAQVGGMVVVNDTDDINTVLVPVYAALGVPMDPSATGSIADVAAVTNDPLTDAFVTRIANGRSSVDVEFDEATRELARTLQPSHVPSLA